MYSPLNVAGSAAATNLYRTHNTQSTAQNHILIGAVPNGGIKYVRIHDLLYLITVNDSGVGGGGGFRAPLEVGGGRSAQGATTSRWNSGMVVSNNPSKLKRPAIKFSWTARISARLLAPLSCCVLMTLLSNLIP